MTLEQLRIFVAVATREHVTRAAADLNLTQSAVSAAISSLEARHDVRLFDRVGRNIVLNQAGELFLQEARAVLARADAAEAALADLGGLKRGRLSAHASQTIASYWLPARLVAFHQAFPGIEVKVEIGNTAEVVAALLAGAAELGLVEGEVDEPALSREPLGEDSMVMVVGRRHPWAERPPEQPGDLLQSGWVLRERGSGTNEAVLSAVEAGAGATAISASVAAAGLRAGLLRRIPFDLPARSFYLLRHKQRYRSKAGDAFVGLARSMAGAQAGDWAMGDGDAI
jgi:DNA-binding transcriptional LysR family regulator